MMDHKDEATDLELHAFQKKAKRGIATPKRDMEIIRTRLRRAEEHQAQMKGRDK
jgi:phage-related protein